MSAVVLMVASPVLAKLMGIASLHPSYASTHLTKMMRESRSRFGVMAVIPGRGRKPANPESRAKKSRVR
jgi:hypothetical protein